MYCPGYWQPTFRSHCYSGAEEKIRRAEMAMVGDQSGLWAKREAEARRLVWC